MSRENVEIVRRWVEAWNRDDLEGMLALLHADCEFRTSGAFPDLDPSYEGHPGFTRFYREFMSPWESFVIAVHDLRACGERVLCLAAFEARARDGLDVRRDTSSVTSFRDGLVVRTENHAEWSQALEAVGLRE
jgi:ketosteroid isomerase-like protein